MAFTCKIQKFDFYADQFEELGEVDLPQAIKAFQNFPFAEQVKQITETDISYNAPSVLYLDASGKKLRIWTLNDEGFYLYYTNTKQSGELYISNSIYENPKGIEVEEFIVHFFNNTIEPYFTLWNGGNILDANSKRGAIHSFSFNQSKKTIYLYLTWAYIGLTVFVAIMGFQFLDNQVVLRITGITTIFWLPGVIVHISYWFKNKGASVIVNTNTKTIEYKKDKISIAFNRDEITHCEINETHSSKTSWKEYKYLWLVLADKRQVVITNFIVEPETIVALLNLKYKTERRLIPFLPI